MVIIIHDTVCTVTINKMLTFLSVSTMVLPFYTIIFMQFEHTYASLLRLHVCVQLVGVTVLQFYCFAPHAAIEASCQETAGLEGTTKHRTNKPRL